MKVIIIVVVVIIIIISSSSSSSIISFDSIYSPQSPERVALLAVRVPNFDVEWCAVCRSVRLQLFGIT